MNSVKSANPFAGVTLAKVIASRFPYAKIVIKKFTHRKSMLRIVILFRNFETSTFK